MPIPYAKVDPETGERICPICTERIAEQYDATGEPITNHYADHYACHVIAVDGKKYRACDPNRPWTQTEIDNGLPWKRHG